MNEEDKILFNKIRQHLADLHQRWDDDITKDGHCKSSEGYIELTASYPNWFEAGSKEVYLNSKPTIGIGVYSYLFGPSRMHDYSSLEEAWNEIKEWGYKPSEYPE